MVKIAFSDHSKKQIERRNIPMTLVRYGIRNSDAVIGSYRGRTLRRLEKQGKLLEIVTVTEGSNTIVITAYYLDED